MKARRLARRLAEEGEEVAHLALIDSFAPGSRRPDRELDRDLDEISFFVTVAGEAGLRLDPAAVEDLRRRDPGERFTRFAALAVEAGLLPAATAEATLRRLLAVHVDVPGNHFTVMEDPHVRRLAEALRQALGRLRGA